MPNFYPEGNTVKPGDGELRTLHKIADAAGGGGGGGGQMLTYSSGTPSNPTDEDSPAIAYDPAGILPTLVWDTSGHTWN